jgi:hypothetical protein
MKGRRGEGVRGRKKEGDDSITPIYSMISGVNKRG